MTWIIRRSEEYLAHYGVKGQKWGVRNYQNRDGTYTELGKQRRRKNHDKYVGIGINLLNKELLKTTLKDANIESRRDKWVGHNSTPKDYKPNAILDHIRNDGSIKTRTFYDEKGRKKLDIHTDNHGSPNAHNFGEHGEHAHDYIWDDKGRSDPLLRRGRELTKDERRNNSDIVNKDYERNNK